ncbi:hypothetical protein [Halorientalis halophila]|uniref:hypothetical protein n=1 Tax=Halorientalis halophila TaxID=3108499 RepID=UPI003009E1DC
MITVNVDANTLNGGLVQLDIEHLLATLEFDGTVPTEHEAAALATAFGAHLADRGVTESDEPETVPEWKLADRFEKGGVYARELPRNVERGREWQAARRAR